MSEAILTYAKKEVVVQIDNAQQIVLRANPFMTNGMPGGDEARPLQYDRTLNAKVRLRSVEET